MIVKTIKRLQFLTDCIPPLLKNMDAQSFSRRPSANSWSKKEILGHLIDSACNNHQRFVRTQFEDIPKIKYDQNNWNKFSYHNLIDKEQLIEFWTVYNKQLLEIIKRIPENNLNRECNTGEEENFKLEFIIDDYVVHLEHHLKQLVSY